MSPPDAATGNARAQQEPRENRAPAKGRVVARTFATIELDLQALADVEFPEFVKALLEEIRRIKDEQFAWYEGLRRKNSGWANRARVLLAWLGSAAFLLTGLAAILRFAPEAELAKLDSRLVGADKYALLIVLVIYAVMGTISFYERGTDKTTAYFRHLAIILAIRDLWTRVQFEILKELTALKSATDQKPAEAAARERIRALAQGFCNDLNKVSSGEFAEWRTEFLASLSELAEAAKKGSDDVTKQVQDVLKTAAKAASDAKAAAAEAEADAKAAARAANEAAKPGAINVTAPGDVEGEIVIEIDGVEAARSRGRTLALERVTPGLRRVTARAMKEGKDVEASFLVEVKPGLQDLKLTF
jgi:hypothetical protein